MIEPAKHIDKVVYPKGTTKDIMTEIMSCYNSTYMQVMPICDNIDKNQSVISICKYVFDLVNDNITYKEDPTGKQLIRTPARLWADKTGDCKSFAIFIGSCMRCLGIPHVFRFASYTSNPDPTHVYIVAYDGNKEIIVDPVYRVRGVALFNQECIYKHKKDMAGTTQISRLSGIGYPGQTTQLIYPKNINITRQEADLYFNLNLLSQWYDISMRDGKTEEAERYLNLMDLCSSAINCFNLERDGVITLNQGLTFLLSLYNAGRFNTPINATQEERETVLSVIYGQTVTESGNYESDSDSYGEIFKITGDDLVGNLLAISEIGRVSRNTIGASGGTFIDPENERRVSETIYDSAEYFTYTMIPDNELSQYPEIVSTKRAEHLNILKDIQESGYASVDQCRAMITTAIEKKWKMTPEMFLDAIKNGDIPVVGLPVGSIIAIIGACVSLIAAIAPILVAVFDKDQFAEDVKLYAPSASDGFFTTTSPDYNWSTGGSGFTTASDYLLPLLLIGGLFVGLASSDKKKKKKKKR